MKISNVSSECSCLRSIAEILPEPRVAETDAACCVQQDRAGLHGIKHAGQFRLHLKPFPFRALHYGAFLQAQQQILHAAQAARKLTRTAKPLARVLSRCESAFDAACKAQSLENSSDAGCEKYFPQFLL